MRDPGKRPFHNPSARQHYKPLSWQQLLPIDHHALVQPLLSPSHEHFLWGRLAWALDEIHAPFKLLLHPVLAPIFSPVASVHPQMFEARKLRIRPPKERLRSEEHTSEL